MKKINWKYVSIFIAFLVLAVALLLYRIGDQHLWTDEVFSFTAAKRLIETGSTTYASGLEYPRASIYHQLLAWSMQLFGENEFGSRIVNIPFVIGSGLMGFAFIRSLVKNKSHSFWLGLLTAGTYITTNLSIALTRETRMYPMLTFFSILTIFAFYKALVKPQKPITIRIWKFEFNFNLTWGILGLLALYIAYNTHPLAMVLGVGVLTYFIMALIFYKKKETLIYILIVLLGACSISLVRYESIDFYDIFRNLSPDWAINPPSLIIYPLMLVKSLPGIFIFSPIILYSIFKYQKKGDTLLFSIFASYLAFISFQRAQPERYLQLIIPVLITLFFISIYRFTQDLPNVKTKRFIIALITVIGGSFHIFLLQKEIKEITGYTFYSVGIQNKMEFQPVFEYLEEKDLNNYIVIADYHAAFTLHNEGYNVDYLLIEEDSHLIKEGETNEPYFNMPYLIYETEFIDTVENQPRIVIIRDFENYPGINGIVNELEEYSRPKIYR